MVSRTLFGLCFLLFVVLAAHMLESGEAALQPFSFLGIVTGKSPEGCLITVQTEYQHSFGASGWTSHLESIEGTALADAWSELNVGDYVEIASLGSPGNYVALAKLVGATNRTVTDIYGDPWYVKTKLLGNCAIEFINAPSPTCSLWKCSAIYSDVIIRAQGTVLTKHRLAPGQTCRSHAGNCNITVTFHFGEVYNPDPSFDGWVGPQATSDFTIHLGLASLNPSTSSTVPIITLAAIIAAIIIVVAVARRKETLAKRENPEMAY